MSHFPDVDRMEAVRSAWPQAPNLVAHVFENERELVDGLNDLLDRRWSISAVRPVPATATEMYLARELFALKIWLRDFDPGF